MNVTTVYGDRERHKKALEYCRSKIGQKAIYSWTLKKGITPNTFEMEGDTVQILIQRIGEKLFFNYNILER